MFIREAPIPLSFLTCTIAQSTVQLGQFSSVTQIEGLKQAESVKNVGMVHLKYSWLLAKKQSSSL